MTTINTIRARIAALKINVESRAAIEQTKATVEDLNRERLLQGRLSDGAPLPPYSITSIKVFGYPPGPWKLKNTGAFHLGINTKVFPKSFVTSSTDPKTEMLKRKVTAKGLDGEDIFGLDAEGRKEYVKELRPVFVNRVREKVRL